MKKGRTSREVRPFWMNTLSFTAISRYISGITNGNVAAGHLCTYLGVEIARAIRPDLDAAASEIRRLGGSFKIIKPIGGYRSWDVQVDMGLHRWPDTKYNLTKDVAVASPGHSRHGFGKAVDVSSNLDHRSVVAIMTAHGFTQYDPAGDKNHFGWGDELSAGGLATLGLISTLLGSDTEDIDMITRRLVRQDNTKGVYYAVNNVLSPVVSEDHLGRIQADLIGLRAAGDAFLVQAGDDHTVTAVTVVADLRTAGILPSTSADLAAIDFDPSQADLDRISAASIANAPVRRGIDLPDADRADRQQFIMDNLVVGHDELLQAVNQVDTDTLATLGLKRIV